MKQERLYVCPLSVKTTAGQQFNQQMAHMLVFHSYLKMIMWASIQRAIAHTVECAHTHSEMRARTNGPAETQRGKLNHIISTQIINDIIFSCSSYNVGQLDTGGNEEAQRGR